MSMIGGTSLRRLLCRAPVIAGALLFPWLALTGCDKRKATPEWGTEAVSTQGQELAPDVPVSNRPVVPAPGLRFMAYNVENWLTMERDGSARDKPEAEKRAVVRLIVEARPDVLGVCEIGDSEDVDDLRRRLQQAGWEMPHLAYDRDSPSLRRLALLSRFPIVSTAEPEVQEYRMLGRNWRMSRPILDATVEREGCRYRFLGVHLKSQRTIQEADQEEMRIHEARLLRRHVDSILEKDPQVRLAAYGDFNDSRKSIAMKIVAGSYRSPTYLTAVPCADSRGHRWTHHWEYQDLYSRFDYVLVSAGLKPEVDFQGSHLLDGPDWEKASDHRALVVVFKRSPNSR